MGNEVTALRVLDDEREVPLPRRARFALGASPRCDLALPGLSAVHCLFERKGNRLRIHDRHSVSGTFVSGRRVEVTELFPGDTFTPGPLTLLAMSEEMRASRPVMADILGAGAGVTPDRLLIDAVGASRHFLITGAPGSDLDRLARAIHAAAPRRPLVEVTDAPDDRARQRELMTRAAGAMLVLDLAAMRAPLDAAFCAMLFSPRYDARVIALGAAGATVRRVFGPEAIARVVHVPVRPLSERRGDVLDLLDRMLVERGAPLRVGDLTPRNRLALESHAWRYNFVDLRLTADRLTAIGRVPDWEQLDWRERAVALGVPKSTLHDWLTVTLGLSAPLFVSP